MSGLGRVQVVTFAKGSPPRCESIPSWQWLIWSRQIANFYDRIRCNAGPELSPDITFNLNGRIQKMFNGSGKTIPDRHHSGPLPPNRAFVDKA
jgi:hypothetical protein